ncbi:hypothetical protein HOD20_06455 [archaeon]|jgi:hypothetical protein|nr:hypothetical protein [archaeon]
MSKLGVIGFLIYLIVGVYLLNVPLNFFPLPGFVQGIHEWIVFVGGILVVLGGINYLRAGRRLY